MTHSIIEIEITDLARGGAGVGRAADGRVIFVPFTAPGDVARVQITKTEKRYANASLIELSQPSAIRQKPPCPVFGICGGCQWQHLPYELQWKTKVQGMTQALGRVGIAADSLPQVEELPAEEIWHYRNRIQLHGKNQALGFFATGRQTLVPIEACPIARPELNARFDRLRTEGAGQGEFLVEVEVLASGEVRESWNQGHAAQGFRQIHDKQNEKLKNWIAGAVGSKIEIIYDLFGGAGNLSQGLAAQDPTRQVHCVDSSAPAIKPLGMPKNLHFYRQPVNHWLRGQKRPNRQACAIIDPPREGLAGAHDEIATALERLDVREIAAIGCDLDSWAKDIAQWNIRGWSLKRVGALDFFPQTTHLESLAWLTRV